MLTKNINKCQQVDKAIVDKTMNIVASWRQLANAYHIPREEQEQMVSAFEYRV